jgi:hypothetical protein
MSYFGILTCAIVIPCVAVIIVGAILQILYKGCDFDYELGEFILTISCILEVVGGCVLAVIYGLIICAAIGPHTINAEHYQRLHKDRNYIIYRMESINEESKDAYQKELDEIDDKIYKQAQTMNFKDWEIYYKLEKEDEQKSETK